MKLRLVISSNRSKTEKILHVMDENDCVICSILCDKFDSNSTPSCEHLYQVDCYTKDRLHAILHVDKIPKEVK